MASLRLIMEILSNVIGYFRETKLMKAGAAMLKSKQLEEEMDAIEQGKKLDATNPDDIDDDILYQ